MAVCTARTRGIVSKPSVSPWKETVGGIKGSHPGIDTVNRIHRISRYKGSNGYKGYKGYKQQPQPQPPPQPSTASPSPTMESTKVGGREAAAHLCGGGREAAASIVGDGEAANITKTYAYTYQMCPYLHICHDSYYFSYVGPGAIFSLPTTTRHTFQLMKSYHLYEVYAFDVAILFEYK